MGCLFGPTTKNLGSAKKITPEFATDASRTHSNTSNTLDLHIYTSVVHNDGYLGVALGDYHSCVLLTDGTMKRWGSFINGQLGDGSIGPMTIGRNTPIEDMASPNP